MDSAITTGFREELQKIGFTMPPMGVVAPVAVGTALSGLALYDFLKSRKLKPDLGPDFITGTKEDQVKSREAIKQLLEERPLIRPVVPVTTEAGISKMVKDPRFGFLTRRTLKSLAKEMVNEGTNAAVIQGEDKDYVIIPTKANPRVVEHEMGHLQDLARKIEDSPGILRRLLGLVWKPEYEKQIMGRERRAWTYAQKTPMSEEALKSYERGFHKTRAGLTMPMAAMMFLRALRASKGGAL